MQSNGALRADPGRLARSHLTVAYRRAEPVSNRFGLRDRVALLAWAAEARAFGICRVSLERPDPQEAQHEIGDFALIYDADAEWASWAVAPEHGSYLLWSPNTGRTIGHFETLDAALAMVRAPAC